MPISVNAAAAAAFQQTEINTPSTHNVTNASNYSVNPGTTFVPFSGTTSRYTIQHNTAGIGIGNVPYKITFHYRKIGNPQGVINIGLRKSAGDVFQLLSQYPLEPNPTKSWAPNDPIPPVLYSVTVEGNQAYSMIASDKVSIEFPPSASDTIELCCGTGLPAGFTSQSWNGSAYSATANPLSMKITSKVLVPI